MTRPHMRRSKGKWTYVDPWTPRGLFVQHKGVWWRIADRVVVWVTEDKRELTIAEMETEHIQRCIANMLIRGNWRLGYLPLLIEELEKRGAGA